MNTSISIPDIGEELKAYVEANAVSLFSKMPMMEWLNDEHVILLRNQWKDLLLERIGNIFTAYSNREEALSLYKHMAEELGMH